MATRFTVRYRGRQTWWINRGLAATNTGYPMEKHKTLCGARFSACAIYLRCERLAYLSNNRIGTKYSQDLEFDLALR